MIISHNFKQGSPEWAAHRNTGYKGKYFFSASLAPIMLALHPTRKRADWIRAMALGLEEAFTDYTLDVIFPRGHRFEALARPLAETILGAELFPESLSNDRYAASFDGITFDHDMPWEHKSVNEAIREAFKLASFCGGVKDGVQTGVSLPEYLCAQLENQLRVNEGARSLFSATAWDETGACVEQYHCYYHADLAMRQRIIDGWAQAEKDIAEYVEPEAVLTGELMPVVREFPQLPTIRFGLVGGTLADVLRFEASGRNFISTINQNLVTDQDFADGESDKKDLANAVKMLDALIDSPQDLAALQRVRDTFNKARIALENQINARKTERKAELVRATNAAYVAHVLALKTDYVNTGGVDFRDAIKGLSSVSSMQQALSAALLKAQSDVSALAARVQANLDAIAAADNDGLFRDKAALVKESPENVANAIKVRLAEHAQKQAAALEKARLDGIEAERKESARIAQLARNANIAHNALSSSERFDADRENIEMSLDELPSTTLRINAAQNSLAMAHSLPIDPPSVLTISAPPVLATEENTIDIGEVNARLNPNPDVGQGITVSRSFLALKGFPGVSVGVRHVYLASDWPCMKAAIIEHLRGLK